ncbi:uncharacterized protein LOC778572 isoform X1 [Ciona intestinalis]
MAFPSPDAVKFGWNFLLTPEWVFPNPAWRVPNLSIYSEYLQMATEQIVRGGVPSRFQLPNLPMKYFESPLPVMQNNFDQSECSSYANRFEDQKNLNGIKRPLSLSTIADKHQLSIADEDVAKSDTNHTRQPSDATQMQYMRNGWNFQESNFRDQVLKTSTETIPEQQYEKPYLKFGVSTILSLDNISKDQSSLNSEKKHPATDCHRGHVQDSLTQDLRSTLITQACHPYSQQQGTQYPHYVTHETYVHSNPVAPILPTWYQGAVRGRGRRGMLRRAVFSDNQRKALEKKFQLQKYIGKPDRKKLALKLGLKDSQVKIWFQNRRMKWRNSQERQMISSSLSTENNTSVQVLPIPKCVREQTDEATSQVAVDE